MRTFAYATAAALAALALAPAQAETRSVRVSHAGIDLSTSAGQAMLEQRVRTAVRKVCGKTYPLDVKANYRARKCRAETWILSQPQIQQAYRQQGVVELAGSGSVGSPR
jgi:UrcA family protein